MQTNPGQIASLSALRELTDRDLLFPAFEEGLSQVYVIDAVSLRFVAANRRARLALHGNMRDLQQKTPLAFLTHMSRARLERLLVAISHRKSQRVDLHASSEQTIIGQFDVSIRHVAAQRPCFLIFVHDVTQVQVAMSQAAYAEERLHTAIDSLADGFVLFDKYDKLVMCNQRYRVLHRNSAEALFQGNSYENILRHGLRHNQFAIGHMSEDTWIDHQLRSRDVHHSEGEQKLSDGTWLRIVERRTSDGGRVGLRMDITRLKQQQTELRKLALTDELTGLLNRRGLARRLNILAAGLANDMRLAILHIDLDRFKAINDMFGHDAGDFVLAGCAQKLQGLTPKADAIARVGGDEFILAVQTKRSNETLQRYAKGLVNLLSTPVEFDGNTCSVGACIGVSFVTVQDEASADAALTAADIALNAAKRSDTESVITFEDRMRQEAVREIALAREMKEGLKRGEFYPHYQPQIDTGTNKAMGFEALIRWDNPKRGMVSAFEFLAIAQRSGMTEALDDIVMDHACKAIRDLQNWGIDQPCVSINLSMGQVSDPNLVDRLNKHLDRYDVSPEHLRIELLESTLLDDRSSTIVRNVHALISHGFKMELDDFGTGHAAIGTLRKFAVSRIKVDRSLVQNIDKDDELQLITSAVLNLAKRLGIEVLAEGVETSPEQQTLQDMGCFAAQGYLHAKPMGLKDLRVWLSDRGDIPPQVQEREPA